MCIWRCLVLFTSCVHVLYNLFRLSCRLDDEWTPDVVIFYSDIDRRPERLGFVATSHGSFPTVPSLFKLLGLTVRHILRQSREYSPWPTRRSILISKFRSTPGESLMMREVGQQV